MLTRRTRAGHVLRLLLVVVTAAIGAASQESASQSPAAPSLLQIAPGDLVSVDVFDTPELSAKLRVSEKGNIDLPVSGELHVAGDTAEEAASRIEATLQSQEILKHPHVSVFIQEYATQGVSVLGEVKNPGVYPNLGSHSLLDFISMAGGVTANAGKAVTVAHKSDPDHPTVIQLDNSPDLPSRAGIAILPGDTIVVSRSGIVYVVGDLVKPGGFLIENNERLTVLQAVALAQGANHTAALDNTRLIRKTPAGKQEIPVLLGKILSGKESDIRLEDGDILFVPLSKGKTALYRGLEAAVSMTTGLVIYNRF